MSKDPRVEALKKGAIQLEQFALNFKFPPNPSIKAASKTRHKGRKRR